MAKKKGPLTDQTRPVRPATSSPTAGNSKEKGQNELYNQEEKNDLGYLRRKKKFRRLLDYNRALLLENYLR